MHLRSLWDDLYSYSFVVCVPAFRCVGASDQQRKEEEAPGGGGDDATDEAHAPGAGKGAAGEARGEGESKSEPNGARVGAWSSGADGDGRDETRREGAVASLELGRGERGEGPFADDLRDERGWEGMRGDERGWEGMR